MIVVESISPRLPEEIDFTEKNTETRVGYITPHSFIVQPIITGPRRRTAQLSPLQDDSHFRGTLSQKNKRLVSIPREYGAIYGGRSRKKVGRNPLWDGHK